MEYLFESRPNLVDFNLDDVFRDFKPKLATRFGYDSTVFEIVTLPGRRKLIPFLHEIKDETGYTEFLVMVGGEVILACAIYRFGEHIVLSPKYRTSPKNRAYSENDEGFIDNLIEKLVSEKMGPIKIAIIDNTKADSKRASRDEIKQELQDAVISLDFRLRDFKLSKIKELPLDKVLPTLLKRNSIRFQGEIYNLHAGSENIRVTQTRGLSGREVRTMTLYNKDHQKSIHLFIMVDDEARLRVSGAEWTNHDGKTKEQFIEVFNPELHGKMSGLPHEMYQWMNFTLKLVATLTELKIFSDVQGSRADVRHLLAIAKASPWGNHPDVQDIVEYIRLQLGIGGT